MEREEMLVNLVGVCGRLHPKNGASVLMREALEMLAEWDKAWVPLTMDSRECSKASTVPAESVAPGWTVDPVLGCGCRACCELARLRNKVMGVK